VVRDDVCQGVACEVCYGRGPLSAPSCRRSFKATMPAVAPFRSLRGPAGPFQMGRERDEGTSLLIEPHVLKPPAVEYAVDDQVEALDARPPAGRGAGVEDDRARGVAELFRETLKSTGNFDFVVSTRIDKVTTERPHFFIAYGTKSPDGDAAGESRHPRPSQFDKPERGGVLRVAIRQERIFEGAMCGRDPSPSRV
jgi:hypothetical protein